MILYNVTCRVEETVHDDWIQWMKDVHIPDVMMTRKFISYTMSRLLTTEPGDAPTYSIQYKLKDMDTFEAYQREDAPALQKHHIDRYGESVLAFRTMMEIVREG